MKNKNNTDVQKKPWKNKDNNDFFERMPISTFQEWTKLGGLDSGCDLDLILKDLQQANTILEVGAGFGRVINYLLNQNLKADIHAIERSTQFFDYLHKRYGDKIHLIHGDINETSFDTKFDVITCLWATISDFTHEEQLPLFKKLSALLNNQGILVIDILVSSFNREKVEQTDKQSYTLTYGDRVLYGRLPDEHELVTQAKALNFAEIKAVPYTTDTQRERLLVIMRKR